MDEEGLVVDELARSLDGRRLLGAPPPGLLYTVATFQNPSGRTLTRERRLVLLDVVNAFGLPLVEDDPYSELRFEGGAVPALKGLQGGDDVVYLGTFSKILSPGMRLGWVAGPRPLIDQLVLAKQASDLHTDSVAQRAALRFCLDNDIDAHVERLRAAYAERRDAMLAALTELMPGGTTWTHPEGGMFLWLTLPPGLDSRELLDEALRLRVAFVPGDAFHVDGGGANCVRLNYTGSAPDRIWEGVARLATATRRLASRR
jgi:2-aminoadipate transaminase